jgi:hypothetical protein
VTRSFISLFLSSVGGFLPIIIKKPEGGDTTAYVRPFSKLLVQALYLYPSPLNIKKPNRVYNDSFYSIHKLESALRVGVVVSDLAAGVTGVSNFPKKKNKSIPAAPYPCNLHAIRSGSHKSTYLTPMRFFHHSGRHQRR